MDAEFEKRLASLGVPFYRTFWRVTVPMALPSIVGISSTSPQRDGHALRVVPGGPGTELAAVRCC